MAANGELDVSTLVQAAGGAPGQKLEAQTAKQWAWMRSDAAKAGVNLAPEPDDGIASCYRDLANQQYAYNKLGYPAAAMPGTSNHGLGTAIDIALTSSITYWLQANAKKYGFVFDVANEPWHAHRTATINPPASSTTGGNQMLVIIKGKANSWTGGLFFVDKNDHATLLTTNSKEYPANVPQLSTDEQITNFRKVVSGI